MDLPFKISASVSGLVLHAEESTGDSYVEFEAFKESDKSFGLVRFKFTRFLGGRMYSMGGEADREIGTIEKSQWLKELNQHQKKWYPLFSNNFKNVNHYYFRGHDVSVEVLAENCSWEIMREFES